MDILRIAALGTAGVLLGITVKGAKPEFALLVTVGAGLCILAGTVGKMQYLLGMLAQMKSYLPVDSSYLNTLLKMLGITYVGQFSAGICKDAGYSSIAGQIELFARLAVLAVSMPVLLALLETVHDFCKKPDGAWRCFFCVSFSEREERRKSKQRYKTCRRAWKKNHVWTP